MKDFLQKLITRFLGEESGEHVKRFMGNAVGTFSIQICSMILAFGLSIFLAKAFDNAAFYGLYAFGTSWLAILSVPSRLGMERLMIRKLSGYRAISNWSLAKGILIKGISIVGIVSTLVAIIMAVVFYFFYEDPSYRLVVCLAMAGLPFFALRTTVLSALKGLNKVWVSEIPSGILFPSIILIIILILKFSGFYISPYLAIGVNVIALLLTLIVGLVMLSIYLPDSIRKAVPTFEMRQWIALGIPFILIATMQSFNQKMGILMLGALSTPENVGVFAICNRGSEIIKFPIMAINLALSPIIAALYAKGSLAKMQTMARKAALGTIIGSYPIIVGLTIFSSLFLGIFGEEYLSGRTTLIILTVGQAFNVTIGSVGVILGMTKHEKFMTTTMVLSLALNIILCWIFIPLWGMNGAAIASVASTFLWNTLLLMGVLKMVKINPTIIGKPMKIKES